jgi:hypothetical protein
MPKVSFGVRILVTTLFCYYGCAGDSSETVNCDNLLPAGQATFSDVTALMINSGSKGCSGCHTTASPVNGYNFEGPVVTYDALTTKMDRIYAQVASGEMPDDGDRWSDSDLRILRSWYCYGAFFK